MNQASIPVAYCSLLHVNFAERSDDWSLDAIESSTFSEQGMETKVKLEETCVLVDGEELHFYPHKECKRRPYKVLFLCVCFLFMYVYSASNWTFFFRKKSGKPFLQE
jgi:hypothetical protein